MKSLTLFPWYNHIHTLLFTEDTLWQRADCAIGHHRPSPKNCWLCLACILERPKDALPPLRVLKTVEDAAEEFIDPSLTDPVEKLDNVLGVINKRARAVVVVLDYLARHK